MDYLENLLSGNIASFRKQIEGKLAEKVFDKLATRKQQIANGLFEAKEAVDSIAKTGDRNEREHLAIKKNTNSETLHHLAVNNSDESIQYYIAANKNTSPETLHHLAMNTKDDKTRETILNHPNTSAKTKRYLKNRFNKNWDNDDSNYDPYAGTPYAMED